MLTSVIIQLTQVQLSEDKDYRKPKWKGRVCSYTKRSDTNANVHIVLKNILTYNKTTFRANHVPGSIVLHQYGIWVVGTLNSGKGQSLSTERTENHIQMNKSMGETQEKARG